MTDSENDGAGSDESLGRVILGFGLAIERLLDEGRQTVRLNGQITKIEVDYTTASALALALRTTGANIMAAEIGRPDLTVVV